MREDNKPGTPLQFYGCAPVANARTIGPVEDWPLEVMQPCPRTGMAVIEIGENATGLWWRAADGSLHIGYQIGDHTTAQAMQGKAIQAALRDLRVYMKAHADMDAGRSWEEVLTEIGFNEKRSYEFWEAYMVRRIMNHLHAAELEAARGYEELTRAKVTGQIPADDTARPHTHPLADPYTAALYYDVEHYRRKWTTQLARTKTADARVAELEAQRLAAIEQPPPKDQDIVVANLQTLLARVLVMDLGSAEEAAEALGGFPQVIHLVETHHAAHPRPGHPDTSPNPDEVEF